MSGDGWILVLIVALSFLAIGYVVGDANGKTPIQIGDIEKYLRDNFPNHWAAYQKGIHEGYEQGLRDCQEPHEPS